MYTSRQQSPQDALHGASMDSAGRHAIALQDCDTPLLEQYHTRGSPSVAFHNSFEFDFDFNFDAPHAVREPNYHSVTRFGQPPDNLFVAGGPVKSPLESEGTNFWGDVIPSTEMQVENSGINRVLRNDGSYERLSTTQPSRASSMQVSSIDWRRYFNFTPSMRSSSGAPAMASLSPRSSSRPFSAIRGGTTPSPRASLHDSVVRATHLQRGSHSMTPQQGNGRATFHTLDSTDLEIIMLPVQMLRSSFIEFLELDLSDRSISERWFSQGSTLDHLYSTLHSNWLSLDMEELMCRGYELCAQAIRRRQATRPLSSNGSSRFLTLVDDDESEALTTERQPIENTDTKTKWKIKPTSRTWRQTSMGRLNLELSTPPRDSPHFDTSDVPYVINISFIPRTQQRTTGLSAVFQQCSSASQVCRIPPRLRTFNVIPDDSRIIECIRRNDISGAQRLFIEGKASPLDVDSRGFSLLSVFGPNPARATINTKFWLSIPRDTGILICFGYF